MSHDLGELGGSGPLLAASRSPDPSAGSPVSFGDYAPSPNTSSQAIHRANQMRVQNLLRRLLTETDESVRIDTLRMLRRTLREVDYRLSWLTQVDFLETIERVLSSEHQHQQRSKQDAQTNGHDASGEHSSLEDENGLDSSWRLVHDATQLLIESVGRLEHEIDQQLVEAIVPSVVENLGHPRSEVRRASLLLLNLLLNEEQRYFRLLMRLFIDYGLTNYRNKQAQRGSILSLPLLISKPIIERGEDLTPLVRCLSELLLIDSNEKLFYSLFLAMQRIHLMIGDHRFQTILRQCEPEAAHLYRQAASRNNSLVTTGSPGGSFETNTRAASKQSPEGRGNSQQAEEPQVEERELLRQQQQQQARQHVTFEPAEEEYDDATRGKTSEDAQEEEDRKKQASPSEMSNQRQEQQQQEQQLEQRREASEGRVRSDSQLSGATGDSLSIGSSPLGMGESATAAEEATMAAIRASRQFSSDVSSTCSSDAHLVNPAHYMTKAALQGNPLDHYEEIHHVDHSNVNSLAINDFGPICNTPTIEFGPQLSAGLQSSLGQHLRANHQCDSPAGAMVLLSSELQFGIFPRHLIQVTLHSARPADRYEALQELMCIVRESPINHLAILMTYFDSFLEQFLAKVLLSVRQRQQQTDCKLELVAIDMIETIIIKTKVSTMQFIRPLVSLLMRALALDGGSQQEQPQQQHPTIFRENTCRVLHKMMAYLPPQHVIDAVFEHKHQKSPVVREEAINRVTAAILEYDRNEFNLTKLCYHVLPMLADQSAAVRLASLECIATLAHVLGPERIGSLLTAAEAVQTGCDYDGLLDAINARLVRHTLPRCQSNGVVRYALKPFLVQHQLQSSGGAAAALPADVRWVVESPAVHHHNHHQHHHQSEHHEAHHHHRVGVYSPPTQEELRRRGSSVGVIGAPPEDESNSVKQHQHHHRRNQHRHQPAAHRSTSTGSVQQQQHAAEQAQKRPPSSSGQKQSGGGNAGAAGSSGSASSDHRARDSSKRPSGAELEISENRHDHSNGKPSEEATSKEAAAKAPDRRRKSQPGDIAGTSGMRRESVAAAGATNLKGGRHVPAGSSETNPQSHQRAPIQLQQPVRRSNSQDSLSSTDTNKVLFQFYLGKFKQSLADSSGNQYQAVLPSDSIIYTDINQAYELSRHQSRFQQTSFEHEPAQRSKTGGRYDEAAQARVNPNTRANNKQDAPRAAPPLGRKRLSIAKMSSGEGSPRDVEEPPKAASAAKKLPSTSAEEPNETSGSESPQTVREAGFGSREASLSRKPRPSIQRQTTVLRGEPASEPRIDRGVGSPERPAARQSRDSAGSLGASRRQSVGASERVVPSNSTEVQPDHTTGRDEAGAFVTDHAGETPFRSQRQRSQSISKHSSGSSVTPSLGNAISSQEATQRQTSGSGGSSHGSGQRLARQESESTTVSSLATSSLSSGGRLDQVGSGGQDEEREAPNEAPRGHDRRHSRRHEEGGERPARRRGDSQSRRRARSKPRASEMKANEDGGDVNGLPNGGQMSERDEIRRRESRSQPPVENATRRNSTAHKSDTAQQQQQQQQLEEPHHHPKAARLIRVRHQSNYAEQQQQQYRRGLVAENGGVARACSVSPGLSNSVNIKQILENVAQLEGPFAEPQLAHKVAMSALESACWSTKVEGLLALIRIAAHHPELMLAENNLHEIVARTADETRNLRSTVARAAIYALGDYCSRLKRSIEPEMDIIVKALLTKSIENTAFIRDDIRRSLTAMADHLTQWRLATLLINQGSQHKSVHVRRMAGQFVALLVERIGAAKALVGAREISHLLLPAAARFAQDQSPHTRYYGRLILSKLMHHSSFERLLRRNLTSTLYRSTIGVIESIKRRGCGPPPEEP